MTVLGVPSDAPKYADDVLSVLYENGFDGNAFPSIANAPERELIPFDVLTVKNDCRYEM